MEDMIVLTPENEAVIHLCKASQLLGAAVATPDDHAGNVNILEVAQRLLNNVDVLLKDCSGTASGLRAISMALRDHVDNQYAADLDEVRN